MLILIAHQERRFWNCQRSKNEITNFPCWKRPEYKYQWGQYGKPTDRYFALPYMLLSYSAKLLQSLWTLLEDRSAAGSRVWSYRPWPSLWILHVFMWCAGSHWNTTKATSVVVNVMGSCECFFFLFCFVRPCGEMATCLKWNLLQTFLRIQPGKTFTVLLQLKSGWSALKYLRICLIQNIQAKKKEHIQLWQLYFTWLGLGHF